MNLNRASDKKLLKKIEKSEEKSLKILNQQKRDLVKAIERNEVAIEQKLTKGTPAEVKVEAEIDKLTKRLESLQTEMTEIRAKREERIAPLRRTDEELREQLRNVEAQIDATMEIRHRRHLATGNGLAGSRISLAAAASPTSPLTRSFSVQERIVEDQDPAASAPPPYSPYWKED